MDYELDDEQRAKEEYLNTMARKFVKGVLEDGNSQQANNSRG